MPKELVRQLFGDHSQSTCELVAPTKQRRQKNEPHKPPEPVDPTLLKHRRNLDENITQLRNTAPEFKAVHRTTIGRYLRREWCREFFQRGKRKLDVCRKCGQWDKCALRI